jgi:hypothetical protein
MWERTKNNTSHITKATTTGIQKPGFDVLWWKINPPAITPGNPPSSEIKPKVLSLIRLLLLFALALSIAIITRAIMLRIKVQIRRRLSSGADPKKKNNDILTKRNAQLEFSGRYIPARLSVLQIISSGFLFNEEKGMG